MANDPKKRAERILKSGIALLVVLAFVGLVAFVISLPQGGSDVAGTSPTTLPDFKASERASAEARRVNAGLAAWGNRVDSVCLNGQVAFPAVKYGTDARIVDMAFAVNQLVTQVQGVQPPANPTAAAQLTGLLAEGTEVNKLWIAIDKRTDKVPDVEQFAAVDRVRNWMTQLVNRGADKCKPLLPGPNGEPARN